MKRSIVLVSVLFILGGSLVFAAGGSQSGTQQGSKILFWIEDGTPPAQRAGYQDVVDAFNKANPNDQVEIALVAGAIAEATQLMTAVRSGTGPDVYTLDRFTVAERAAAGFLEDLTPYISRLEPDVATKHLDFAWAETQYKGKTYALPVSTDTRALFYRKDILREAGIDISPLDPKNGPITIAQLKEIAKKLDRTDAQGNYTRLGFVPYLAEGWHYVWGLAWGGSFADYKAGKVTPLDSPIVAAFQMAYEWAKEYGPEKLANFSSTYLPPNNPPQMNPFLTGTLVMKIDGDWHIPSIKENAPNIEWGVTYPPVQKAGDKSGTFAGGGSLVVPAGSKKAEAAVKFILFASGAEGQRLYCGRGGLLPTVLSVVDDPGFYDADHTFFRSLLPMARSRPPLPVGALYWDNLTTAWEAMRTNTKTPQEALRDVEASTQSQLNRFLPLQ
jgi:multiple sugar transport system substrate-binding protein